MRSALPLAGVALVIAGAMAPRSTMGNAATAPVAPRAANESPPMASPTSRTTDEFTARDGAELAALLAAPNGPRVVRLEPHAYDGDLHVTRPVELRGSPGTTLRGSGTGSVVTIDAADVVLQGLTIRGSGNRHTTEDAGIRATGRAIHVRDVVVDGTLFGIRYAQCTACSIERAHVIGRDDVVGMRGDGVKIWESDDVLVKDMVVERSRDVVVWYSRRATIDGVRVTGSRYGTHFMYAHGGVVRGSRFERDVVGVFVMYSSDIRIEGSVLAGARGAAGVGIGLKESDDVVLDDDWLVANSAGMYLDQTPRSPDHPVVLRGDVLALNGVALRLHSSEKGVSVRDCDFRDNLRPVEVDGGGDALGLDVQGNRWTEYEGYDLDGDGRGDVPFQVKKLSSDVKDAHPGLRLFDGTVTMGLIDAVAEATPMFASQLVLVDRSPRMQAVSVEEPAP
jgi:nitrous oxidase accessory protein